MYWLILCPQLPFAYARISAPKIAPALGIRVRDAGDDAGCGRDFLATLSGDVPISPEFRPRELVGLILGRNPSRVALGLVTTCASVSLEHSQHRAKRQDVAKAIQRTLANRCTFILQSRLAEGENRSNREGRHCRAKCCQFQISTSPSPSSEFSPAWR
jgi:hypothetical protein